MNRRSIRAKQYDYSWPGTYFVTICTADRQCLFGDIRDGRVGLSSLGCVVAEEWQRTSVLRPEVQLDEFVVMPNHFHALLIAGAHRVCPFLDDVPRPEGARGAPLRRPARCLGSIIAGFKAAVSSRAAKTIADAPAPIWQRNYFEHIVRNDSAAERIREYIANNPIRWELDRENPNRVGEDPFARWFRETYS